MKDRGEARWRHVGSALTAMFALVACNMISGADGVTFSSADDDGGSSTGETASGGGTQTGGPLGSGAGPTGVGGSTGSAGGETGAGAGPTVCEYPQGPYGVAQGAIVPPNLSWQGYAPGASTPSTISIADLFDCDGSRGIDAIIVDTSQYG
ncbi:MAG: hypothetical protein KC731_03860 [Myxococcales bacterium]|nr:hypothetical protein [Myxococcales bacterium]